MAAMHGEWGGVCAWRWEQVEAVALSGARTAVLPGLLSMLLLLPAYQTVELCVRGCS